MLRHRSPLALGFLRTPARARMLPPAGRKHNRHRPAIVLELLDFDALSANPRAYRATRVASDVIASPTRRAGDEEGTMATDPQQLDRLQFVKVAARATRARRS